MVEPSTQDVQPLSAADVEREDADVLVPVRLVARSTEDHVDGVLAPTGLSADEYAVFSMLRPTGGTTPTELAQWMAAPPTTVSADVKRSAVRGLVTRVPNPDDGRSTLLRLTPAGLRTHDAKRQRVAPVRSDVIERLAGDHLAVANALMTLRTAVDRLRAACSGEEVDTPPSDGAHRSGAAIAAHGTRQRSGGAAGRRPQPRHRPAPSCQCRRACAVATDRLLLAFGRSTPDGID